MKHKLILTALLALRNVEALSCCVGKYDDYQPTFM